MNRFGAIWMASLALAAPAFAAHDSPVTFGESIVAPEVAVQGAHVSVRIPFRCESGWRYLAYAVGVYRPYAPAACNTEAPWTLTESRHGRQWDSYVIRKWTWHHHSLPQPEALEFSLDTTGWPPGDYRLHVNFLFRNDVLPKGSGQGKRDRYLHHAILLSVVQTYRIAKTTRSR